jgi:acetyl/propionyl-CoA carboxylase alpha subunit
MSDPLTVADAEEELAGLPLVPAMAGSIAEMKALRDRCLAAGIPVLVGCPPGAGKG